MAIFPFLYVVAASIHAVGFQQFVILISPKTPPLLDYLFQDFHTNFSLVHPREGLEYKCSVCSKEFKKPEHLKQHRLAVTPSKQYVMAILETMLYGQLVLRLLYFLLENPFWCNKSSTYISSHLQTICFHLILLSNPLLFCFTIFGDIEIYLKTKYIFYLLLFTFIIFRA